MRRLLALSAAFFIVASTAMHAQILSVYGTFSPAHITSAETGSTLTNSGVQTQYTDFWAPGVGGGVTLNFLPLPLLRLGIDVRGSTKPGTTGADTAMGGIRLQIRPPVIKIRPYIQGSVGYLATRTVATSGNVGSSLQRRYLAYEVIGGIDYPLMRFIDFRIIEVGGGQAVDAGLSSTPTILTLNTGLVLHF